MAPGRNHSGGSTAQLRARGGKDLELRGPAPEAEALRGTLEEASAADEASAEASAEAGGEEWGGGLGPCGFVQLDGTSVFLNTSSGSGLSWLVGRLVSRRGGHIPSIPD